MSLIKNARLRVKLFGMVGFAVLILMTVGIVGSIFLRDMESTATDIYSQQLLSVKNIDEMRVDFQLAQSDLLQLFLLSSSQQSQTNALERDLKANLTVSEKLLTQYEHQNTGGYEQNKVKSLATDIQSYSLMTLQQLDSAGHTRLAYEEYVTTMQPLLQQIEKNLGDLATYNANLAQQNAQHIHTMIQTINVLNGSMLVVAVLILTIIAVFLTNLIVGPVKRLQAMINRVGEGDLTVRADFESRDEIGQLANYFNKMVQEQRALVISIQESATTLSAGSEQTAAATEESTISLEGISSSTQNLAEQAERGSTAILNLSEILAQLSSLIQIAKDKAGEAKASSDVATNAARNGKRTVLETKHSMEIIKAKAEETESWMNNLNEYSSQIQHITTTITEISDQTNLLALNAAIEAARAGEQGRGFMVVAEEVKKLANQSRRGADEVGEILGRILETTNSAVVATEASRDAVYLGYDSVQEVDDALVGILEAVDDTVRNVQDIRRITDDEVRSSETVVQLIHSVASLIENTSANAEQVATSLEEMNVVMESVSGTTEESSSMAQELSNKISKFKV